jgi:hypothetical protein
MDSKLKVDLGGTDLEDLTWMDLVQDLVHWRFLIGSVDPLSSAAVM